MGIRIYTAEEERDFVKKLFIQTLKMLDGEKKLPFGIIRICYLRGCTILDDPQASNTELVFIGMKAGVVEIQ
jgi:hypothetical protein